MVSELAQQTVSRLHKLGNTLCTAESCTGGQIAAAITRVPGSSEMFVGGVVAYANSVKRNLLDVDQAVLQQHGAVSEQVALQMAAGARRRFRADYAVSTTGVAGPGGGTDAKPVGLVWIAWATQSTSRCESFNFTGSREEVQSQAVHEALSGLFG